MKRFSCQTEVMKSDDRALLELDALGEGETLAVVDGATNKSDDTHTMRKEERKARYSKARITCLQTTLSVACTTSMSHCLTPVLPQSPSLLLCEDRSKEVWWVSNISTDENDVKAKTRVGYRTRRRSQPRL